MEEQGSIYQPLRKVMDIEINLDNRDPNNLSNDVVKIDFVDVVAEPEGTHSIDLCWKASYFTFACTKICFYRFFTVVLGIPLSFFWGLFFAIFSFIHIWMVLPSVRCFLICIQCDAHLCQICVRLFVEPFFVSVGKMYSNIKANIQKKG